MMKPADLSKFIGQCDARLTSAEIPIAPVDYGLIMEAKRLAEEYLSTVSAEEAVIITFQSGDDRSKLRLNAGQVRKLSGKLGLALDREDDDSYTVTANGQQHFGGNDLGMALSILLAVAVAR